MVVHARHISVFAEMSSMAIGAPRQDLDLIEAEARQAPSPRAVSSRLLDSGDRRGLRGG